jgi:hypothetical protein
MRRTVSSAGLCDGELGTAPGKASVCHPCRIQTMSGTNVRRPRLAARRNAFPELNGDNSMNAAYCSKSRAVDTV